MIQSEIYPWQPSKKTVEVYNNIATKLHIIILEVANKLNINPSDVRASLDGIWYKKDKHKGLAIQIKSKDNTWEKPWGGNNLIIQTPNNEGVVIKTNDFNSINLDGIKNKELRVIFDNACELNLDKHITNLNNELVNSLTPSDIRAVAPNTPIIVTGKA
jgi:hypothetical protein